MKCNFCSKEIKLTEKNRCLLKQLTTSGIVIQPICDKCFDSEDLVNKLLNIEDYELHFGIEA